MVRRRTEGTGEILNGLNKWVAIAGVGPGHIQLDCRRKLNDSRKCRQIRCPEHAERRPGYHDSIKESHRRSASIAWTVDVEWNLSAQIPPPSVAGSSSVKSKSGGLSNTSAKGTQGALRVRTPHEVACLSSEQFVPCSNSLLDIVTRAQSLG